MPINTSDNDDLLQYNKHSCNDLRQLDLTSQPLLPPLTLALHLGASQQT